VYCHHILHPVSPLGFLTKMLCEFLPYPLHATFPIHKILFDLITFGEQYKWWLSWLQILWTFQLFLLPKAHIFPLQPLQIFSLYISTLRYFPHTPKQKLNVFKNNNYKFPFLGHFTHTIYTNYSFWLNISLFRFVMFSLCSHLTTVRF